MRFPVCRQRARAALAWKTGQARVRRTRTKSARILIWGWVGMADGCGPICLRSPGLWMRYCRQLLMYHSITNAFRGTPRSNLPQPASLEAPGDLPIEHHVFLIDFLGSL